jgi:hypothetical protein
VGSRSAVLALRGGLGWFYWVPIAYSWLPLTSDLWPNDYSVMQTRSQPHPRWRIRQFVSTVARGHAMKSADNSSLYGLHDCGIANGVLNPASLHYAYPPHELA